MLRIQDFEAVIFDMDGVLIDSEPLWKIAMEKVFSDLSCNLSKNDFQRTVGLRIDEVIHYWNKNQNLGISDEKKVEDDIINRMVELVTDHPIPLKGVVDTLIYLKGKNIKKLISYLPDKSLIYFTSSNMSRSMSHNEIEESIGENINFDKDPIRVYSNILSQASSDDLIIITGSNYIAKEIFS